MNIDEAMTLAESWIAGDPDSHTREQLRGYLERRDEALLVELMSGSLEFGTAGLRAVVGPGPRRMNRAVVRQTTAGVARYLERKHAGTSMNPIIVASDARTSSAAFLREAVGVLAAHGLPVRFFPQPVATPIAAYVARRLQASACIVITASHNPADYNGYKLYGGDAVQLVPPEDAEITREIERSAPAKDEPTAEGALDGGHAGVEPVAGSLLEDYFRDVARLRPKGGAPRRDLCIAYTPLHGVGAVPLGRVLADAGFSNVHVVATQREPDGLFPTVSFPNPEEPGALDLVTELAKQVGADLLIANDPDVDRLAASLPDGSGGWMPLTGNQLGILLADFALERAPSEPPPLLVQSIVSSPMLRSIASAYGAHLEQTLTGFKWIWTAALELMNKRNLSYVFGYEEALGYSIGDLVRDKDGISAALVLCELAALERDRGSSVRERLARLYREHGLWVSVQRSVTRHGLSGAEQIRAAMQAVTDTPPERIAGARVSAVTDYRKGGEQRPRWLGNTSLVELALADRGRILVRPSGTEPKLKIYVDLCDFVGAQTDVWKAEAGLRTRASELAGALVSILGLS